MNNPSTTVCEHLDELEAKLPPLAANTIKLNRAAYSRTTRDFGKLAKLGASSASAFVRAAEVGLRTIAGTANWSAEETTSVATTGARHTVGQTKAQTKLAVEKTSEEIAELADDIAPATASTPSASDLKDKTKRDLYDIAQELDITGRSTMSKTQLITAITNA